MNFGLKKLSVYEREPANAQDTSSTESVMLEYINKSTLTSEDKFFLIQATSPLLKSEHIDSMYDYYIENNYDSIFSGVREKQFKWLEGVNNGVGVNGVNYGLKPVNYDYKNRPRRQDFEGLYMENGACYINKVSNIIKYKNRLSGKISIYEMPEYTSQEIDEPDDFLIIERLMERHKND